MDPLGIWPLGLVILAFAIMARWPSPIDRGGLM